MRLDELGQMRFNDPMTITVLLHGKPTTFSNVMMIDPRFEFANYPKPEWSKSKLAKFMGEEDFSLPLVGQMGNITQWLVSNRDSIMTGTGHKSMKPEGHPINDFDWSKAMIMNSDGSDMISQLMGGDHAWSAAHAG
jgi:hypothetical protein